MKDEEFLDQKLVECNKHDLLRAMKMLEKVEEKKTLSDKIIKTYPVKTDLDHYRYGIYIENVRDLIKTELKDVDDLIFMYKNFGAGENPIEHVQKVLVKFKKRLEERAGKKLI